jgi:hypothetical protein
MNGLNLPHRTVTRTVCLLSASSVVAARTSDMDIRRNRVAQTSVVVLLKPSE